jgi:hypothetical protein
MDFKSRTLRDACPLASTNVHKSTAFQKGCLSSRDGLAHLWPQRQSKVGPRKEVEEEIRGMFERKVNNAGLFPNTRNDKSDLDGSIEVECAYCGKQTSFWVAGWNRATRAGAKYISLSLRPKKVGEHGTGQPRAAVADDDL